MTKYSRFSASYWRRRTEYIQERVDARWPKLDDLREWEARIEAANLWEAFNYAG